MEIQARTYRYKDTSEDTASKKAGGAK